VFYDCSMSIAVFQFCRYGKKGCFIVTVVDIDDNGGNDHVKHKLWSI